MAEEDEDEGVFGGLYEDGHWAWDDTEHMLVFISDIPPQPVEIIQMSNKAPTGTIEFRDDIDLIEQDVKDIALFTAPVYILSPMLINALHLSTTERFLKALILYCGYYLQTSEEIAHRLLDQEKKIRTRQSEIIESEYRDNLADLRVLVAKEYCTMIMGGADTKRLHHMGPYKKSRSLSDKDARFYETLLRMAVQIVWLALGRKCFNQIELEVNRIFKTEIFNSVEHMLKTGYISKMAKEERAVLFGECLHHDMKLNTRSPLMNEVFCYREIDYRLMGLGVIKCTDLSHRMRYLALVLAGPEEALMDSNATLGIIGLPRKNFDTMLRNLPEAKSKESASSMSVKGSPSKASAASRTSTASLKKSQASGFVKKLYPDIVLPLKDNNPLVFYENFDRFA